MRRLMIPVAMAGAGWCLPCRPSPTAPPRRSRRSPRSSSIGGSIHSPWASSSRPRLSGCGPCDGSRASGEPTAFRSWFFGAGLVAIAVALLSPVEAYEPALHITWSSTCYRARRRPLFLAAAPITLTLRAASPPVRRSLLGVIHSPVVKVISFPVIAWVLFGAVNWGWHFSTLYDDALENQLLHYLRRDVLRRAPVLVARHRRRSLAMAPPSRCALFYLFLAMPQNSFLGVALLPSSTSSIRTTSRTCGRGASPRGSAAGRNDRLGVFSDIAFLAGMAVVVWLWSRHEERRTARLDRRLARRAARGEEPWSSRGRG